MVENIKRCMCRAGLLPYGVWLGVVLCGSSASAQWVSLSYTLQPGWNAIYLPFQPVPSDCATVFSNCQVESISWWSRQPGGEEFVFDVGDPFPRVANWRKWVPNSPASTFSHLLAGESYLVHCTNSVVTALTLQGTAQVLPSTWIPGEYNLVGLPVPTTGTVTFSSFFSFTDQIDLSGPDRIHTVNPDGSLAGVFWPTLTNPAPERGKAYWIKCGTRASTFTGPFVVSLGSAARRMDFSNSFIPQTLRIKNDTEEARKVSVRHVASAEPPGGEGNTPLAGKTPLLRARMNLEAGFVGEEYVPWEDIASTNVPAGETLLIKLMVDIPAVAAVAEGQAWQSIFEVSDENNGEDSPTMLQRVGVYCDVPDSELFNPAGLWVGSVSVDRVSRACAMIGTTNFWDHTEPVAVSRAYSFRVLIHVDGSGTSRLLQEVYPAFSQEANTPEKLFVNASLADQDELDDPQARVVRISTANLPVMSPLGMTGSFGSSSLSGTVELPFNAPANPFVHPYHPQHDNKEYRNEMATALADGEESFSVTRELTFDFAETAPAGSDGRWGMTRDGGTFTEVVHGLNKTIYASGSFWLEKVSECAELEGLIE